MYGSAVFTIVMSSSSMNVPTQTASRVHHLRSIGRRLRARRAGRFNGVTVDRRRAGSARSCRPDCGTGCGWTRCGRPSTSRWPPARTFAPQAARWAADKRSRFAVAPGRAGADGEEAPRDDGALRGRRDRRRRLRHDGARPGRARRGSSRGSCSTSPPRTATTRAIRCARPSCSCCTTSTRTRRPRARRSTASARRWSRPTSAPSCSATRRSRCGSRRCSASARRASSPGG